MNHQQIQHHVFLLKDSEISTPERAQFQTHLLNCKECCGMIREWEILQKEIQQVELPESEQFVESVMEKVKLSQKEEVYASVRSFLQNWVPVFGLVSAFAVCLFSFTHYATAMSTNWITMFLTSKSCQQKTATQLSCKQTKFLNLNPMFDSK